MAGATPAARTFAKVAQYGLKGTNDAAVITPFDSGTILGTVPPGQAGLKQVEGTVQRATDLTTDGTINAVLAGQDAAGNAAESSYQAPSAGLSLAANHE